MFLLGQVHSQSLQDQPFILTFFFLPPLSFFFFYPEKEAAFFSQLIVSFWVG